MKSAEYTERFGMNKMFVDFVKSSGNIAAVVFVSLFSICLPGTGFAQMEKKHPIGDNRTCWQEANQIGCFTNMDKVFPMREIANGGPVLDLPTKRQSIQYRHKGVEYSASDFLDHHRILSLLVIKDGKVIEEQYRQGTNADTRFYSASMAKTVVAMLVGIAVDKGLIKSLDDIAETYVPELVGSAYGKVSIEHLLRMSSGVRMSPMGDGKLMSDERRFFQTERGLLPQPVLDFLRAVPGGQFKPGSEFRYVSTDTVVLGYVLSRASGESVSKLFSDWIWKHIGAGHPAQWRLMKDGVEYGGGDLFATSRDYGRFGMLLALGGKMDGKQIIPAKWITMATQMDEQSRPNKPGGPEWFGYGFQTWLFPLRTPTFGLRGAYGQSIFVQPRSGLIMVVTAAIPEVFTRDEVDERSELWYGVLRSLNGYLR